MRGRPPGYMISEYEPKKDYKRSPGSFVECPGCGGQMRKDSKLCHACHIEQNGTFDPIADRAERQDRQKRWDMALAVGWTFAELYGGKFDPDNPKKDKLPTWEQIAARRLEQLEETLE